MWREYLSATSLGQAIESLAKDPARSRIIAGGTDLILEMERGARGDMQLLVDITRVRGLNRIERDEDGWIWLGPLVTHNDVVASKLLQEQAFPLARACWDVGAPQIRNRGTIAGNLITASPANDTIPPLMALGAVVVLQSVRGERRLPLEVFYEGVRRTAMAPDEVLTSIGFPAMAATQRGTYVKHSLRAAQAIAVVSAAAVVELDGARNVTGVALTLGAVAPTIIHARQAETMLIGRRLDEAAVREAARLAAQESRPIDDVRGSAAYRRLMVEVCVARALRAIAMGAERDGYPPSPPLLWGRSRPMGGQLDQPTWHREQEGILTRVNGKEFRVRGAEHKTLLRMLREDLGLVGTKEGCAEGECGACTVYLDGVAVMACLVPAPRAHQAELVTVEGLAEGTRLHPVQQAFVEAGAVQCGYCTPGLVMSAAKLLEEMPRPTREQAAWALAGNLCRCTGYYKILEAIERAAQLEGGSR